MSAVPSPKLTHFNTLSNYDNHFNKDSGTYELYYKGNHYTSNGHPISSFFRQYPTDTIEQIKQNKTHTLAMTAFATLSLIAGIICLSIPLPAIIGLLGIGLFAFGGVQLIFSIMEIFNKHKYLFITKEDLQNFIQNQTPQTIIDNYDASSLKMFTEIAPNAFNSLAPKLRDKLEAIIKTVQSNFELQGNS